MTTYTAFGGVLPAGTSASAAGARTDSLVFEITTTAGTPTLTGVWYYVPSSETVLTGSSYTALVYTTVSGTTGTLVTSNAGSGTFTAGAWNFIPLTSPVVLSTGVFYSACVSSPNWLQFEHTMWGPGDPLAGGITAGPVFVPDQSGAPGGIQQGFVSSASTFPNQANVPGSFYGVDISVSTSGGGTNISAQLAAALAAAAPALSGSERMSGVLAAPLAPAAAAARGLVKQNVSGQLAASLAPTGAALRHAGPPSDLPVLLRAGR